ncbi:MAG: primosomal protein N' [Patescibacteria group bacterium]|nr:primosomal protein N' [Patescibacteria group bacterium]
MFLVSVIPITYLPRSQNKPLSYFSLKKLAPLSLVFVSFGNRKTEALVIKCEEIKSKIAIKKAEFQIKPIEKIINPNPIITPQQWELLKMASIWYYNPLSSLLKNIISPIQLFENLSIKTQEIKINNEVSSKPKIILTDDFDYLKNRVKETLNKSQQVLFLFPNQIKLEFYYQNFSEFHDQIFIFEKKGSKKFFKNYQKINTNEIKIIFGKQSALFAPFNNLGLIIIVDEDNDGFETFETKIHYNVKKLALFLSEKYNIEIILITSILSLEAFLNIQNKKYITPPSFKLLNDKINLSHIQFQDFHAKKDGVIHSETKNTIERILKNNGKILIYNNRRGHSPALVCEECGFIFQCPNCDAAMVYHQNEQPALICHHCGFQKEAPDICPQCQSHLIQFIGFGNQKIYDYFKKFFPNYKTAVFDSDHLKNLRQEKDLFQKFINGEVSVLIVTELFSKFFDLMEKRVDLIVIPSLEQLLVVPSFKTEERIRKNLLLFSQKTQQLIVQTFDRNKSWLKDFFNEKFYEKQLEIRKMTLYPPYAQLIKIQISNKNPQKTIKIADYCYNLLHKNSQKLFTEKDYVLSKPISPLISRVNNLYFKEIYWRLKIEENINLLIQKRNKILSLLPDEITIEIDPVDIF